MTAQALEQSVLESKDKDQLLAIAKALGLKASARNKKAEIIEKILTTTGSSSGRRRCRGGADTRSIRHIRSWFGGGRADRFGTHDLGRPYNGPSTRPVAGAATATSTKIRPPMGARGRLRRRQRDA